MKIAKIIYKDGLVKQLVDVMKQIEEAVYRHLRILEMGKSIEGEMTKGAELAQT